MNEPIQFHSRIGADGILDLHVNLGLGEAVKDVVVTIQPISGLQSPQSEADPWQDVVDRTYGSCAGLDLKRPSQGVLETREPIE